MCTIENAKNGDKQIRRMHQIFSMWLNKNSSTNTLNENMRIRRIHEMKSGALEENAK
jgi:hypothetical protein